MLDFQYVIPVPLIIIIIIMRVIVHRRNAWPSSWDMLQRHFHYNLHRLHIIFNASAFHFYLIAARTRFGWTLCFLRLHLAVTSLVVAGFCENGQPRTKETLLWTTVGQGLLLLVLPAPRHLVVVEVSARLIEFIAAFRLALKYRKSYIQWPKLTKPYRVSTTFPR